MKFLSSLFLTFFVVLPLWCQEGVFVDIDSLYREDQFYAGISYNLLIDKPTDVSQNGFSSGIHLGFIRDMPINTRRNISIGLGIGYSGNSFNQNLQISKDDLGVTNYEVLSNRSTFTKNKFSTHIIEMPLEFRWRTSTKSSYKFWRIYTGFKLGYLITHTTKYRGDPEDLKFSNIDNFNKLQYGLSLSFGYNTVNFHFYYGLNPIFNDQSIVNNERIDMRVSKIGLLFYIL